jgi:nucleotide-binding universal stress UspA family protein
MAASVVVGVDGSADSAAALRWALQFAGERRLSARVVHVWTPVPWYDELPDYRREQLAADRARSAEQAAERTTEALRGLELPPDAVEAMVVEGAPGEALVELSRDAQLLVVGATGRGTGADDPDGRIGATARYVTRHALCPVTVVGRHRRPTSTGVLRYRTIPVPTHRPIPDPEQRDPVSAEFPTPRRAGVSGRRTGLG